MLRTQNRNPLTHDELRRMAPAIFTRPEEVRDRRGERYSFIPTIDVIYSLQRQGFYPIAAGQTHNRRNRLMDDPRHMVVLRNQEYEFDKNKLVPELLLLNSHNGTSSIKLMSGIFRAVCANGMVVKSLDTGDFSYRHINLDFDDVIEGSFMVIDESKKTIDKMIEWKGIEMNPADRIEYAAQAALARWGKPEAVPKHVNLKEIVTARRYEDVNHDLFHVYQVAQENLLRGTARHVRKITSIDSGIDVNVRLFNATEEWARTH